MPRIKQPNSLHCFVCGVDNREGFGLAFYETGPDVVEAEVVVPPKFEGYPGIAHGGIIAALLDEITWRASVIGQPKRLVVTGRLDMRLRKPVPVGSHLRLRGRLLRRKSHTAIAHGEVLLDSGEVAAEAEAVLFEDQRSIPSPDAAKAMGWMVYPDDGEGS
ncbi:MAG TPA: PaaI family thioesterase [Anaerolineales bacterium]|nr:PaaI family thioesterase [Anaerolineales bacterium]